MRPFTFPYHDILQDATDWPGEFFLSDHIGGFSWDMHNDVLAMIDRRGKAKGIRYNVKYIHFIDPFHRFLIEQNYPNINLLWHTDFVNHQLLYQFCYFRDYNTHPDVDFKNFVCSFNRNIDVGRKLVLAHLHQRGWADLDYVSKGFVFTVDELDGHIQDFVGEQSALYRKFFINSHSEDFFKSTRIFGDNILGPGHDQKHGIRTLAPLLTQSFVHLSSECMSISAYPYVTEKFLYSVVNRGLFVSNAQPGWHGHVERYYGFRQFNKVFDYRFDTISDPVRRLIALTDMLSKFSRLSKLDWHDLYGVEHETLEFNYDHYFSNGWINQLSQYNNF